MVQMGANVHFPDPQNDTKGPNSGWAEIVREAAEEFVCSLSESSKQLASAAERFAGDSMQFIEEATERAKQSETSTRDLAGLADQAAAEAAKREEDE